MSDRSKNYVGWYRLKVQTEHHDFTGNFSEREVWWCSIGANIGDEEDGKNNLFERPVLVLRKYSKSLFLALPLSTTRKVNQFYHPIVIGDVNGVVLLSQGRALSSKRLLRRLGRIDSNDQDRIWQAYQELNSVKSKPPIKSGESRAPNGDLLHLQNSKKEDESQAGEAE